MNAQTSDNLPKTPTAARPAPGVPAVDETSEENLREKRYLWTARAFAIVAAISFCTNLILIMALFSLVPLKRVQPFLLNFQDKNSQVVRIDPLDITPDGLNYITESMIRQYIIVRHSIVADAGEMLRRWGEDGPVRWMSSEGVFGSFLETTREAFARLQDEGLTRQVTVLSVTKLKTDPVEGDVWEAEVQALDMTPGQTEPKVTDWVIRLRVQYQRKREQWEFRLKNPLGFTIREYGMWLKGAPGSANSMTPGRM